MTTERDHRDGTLLVRAIQDQAPAQREWVRAGDKIKELEQVNTARLYTLNQAYDRRQKASERFVTVYNEVRALTAKIEERALRGTA